jgi:hypothetical protein
MNKQTARELLMDYLYGEISETGRKKLEQYLQTHPEMQQELKELQSVRSLLQKAPDIESDTKLLPVEPKTRSFSEWRRQAADVLPRSGWAKAALAAAACILLLFIGVAAANLNIQSTNNGVSFHLGYGKQRAQVRTNIPKNHPSQIVLAKQQLETLARQMQKKNADILTEYAKKLTKKNQRQLQQIAAYFKQKRMNNFQQLEKAFNHYQIALNQYQQQTNYRLLQTHQAMGQIVKAVAAKDQQ